MIRTEKALNKNSILIIILLALIPSVLITSYSVQEFTISRDSYSEDNYLLFENEDGTDQMWVDGDGFVYSNGTLLGGASTMESLSNVTSTGCATGEILKVSGTTWGCDTDDMGAGGTITGEGSIGRIAIWNATNIINSSSSLTFDFETLETNINLENLNNVTDVGCASGQILEVSGSSWACATPSAGGGGGFSTVYKTADETINSDNTLTDDADLQFSADANSVYAIFLVLLANAGSSTPDIKANFSIPSGASGFLLDGSYGFNFAGTATDVTTVQVGALATGRVFWNSVAIIETDSTAGTIAFAWAQQTSDAADTTIYKGSWLMYKKLN